MYWLCKKNFVLLIDVRIKNNQYNLFNKTPNYQSNENSFNHILTAFI